MTETLIQKLLLDIPYAQTLGVKVIFMGDEMTLHLPYSIDNIGNPILPALHGGCIGGFMEIAAIAQLILVNPENKLPKPIGVNVDFLRRGKPQDSYARVQIFRLGSRVANVRVRAWQENYDDPIATLHGNYLISKPEPEL